MVSPDDMKDPFSTDTIPNRESGETAGASRAPWLFFLAALLLALPLAYFADVPERDIATRYAPMAEAFAAGKWAYAFHPRVPMLYPALCGALVRICGFSGFTAAKLLSAGCFAAAVFPLFSVMRRVFGGRIAAGALLVYVVNPFMLRLAGTGLRENTKCLLLILIVHAVFLIREKPDSFVRYLYLGVAAGTVMITRSEMILFCGIVLFGVMILDARRGMEEARVIPEADPAKKKFVPVPYRGLAGTLLTAGIVFFPAVVNHAVFGLPTPEVRYLTLFESVFGRAPSLADAALIAGLTPFGMAAAAKILARIFDGKTLKPMLIACGVIFAAFLAVLFVRQMLRADSESMKEFFLTFERAFDPLWTAPALVGLAFRLRDRAFSPDEKLLLVFIAVYTGVIALQLLYEQTLTFSVRYLLPVSPLGFGWTFCGVAVIAGLAARCVPRVSLRPALTVLLCAYVLGALFHCLGPILKDNFEPRHKTVRLGTLRLAALFRADPPAHSCAAPPAFDLIEYEGCAAPGMFFEHDSKYIVSAYLAGGRRVRDLKNADFYVSAPAAGPALPPDAAWAAIGEPVPMGRESFCTVFRRKEPAL
ncbi:MAG: glycosyltransferase family 39 protein [Lentisphaeria bacterium]|nr:glycosyltransferase family 39 protein [Lentisphaeria bacterium]